jgi:hypothetical protein
VTKTRKCHEREQLPLAVSGPSASAEAPAKADVRPAAGLDVLDPFETFVLLNCTRRSGVLTVMTNCRILYFREGILEASDEVACDDLLAAAKLASSTHPHLMAEIWWNQKKVGVVRPCWNRRGA